MASSSSACRSQASPSPIRGLRSEESSGCLSPVFRRVVLGRKDVGSVRRFCGAFGSSGCGFWGRFRFFFFSVFWVFFFLGGGWVKIWVCELGAFLKGLEIRALRTCFLGFWRADPFVKLVVLRVWFLQESLKTTA